MAPPVMAPLRRIAGLDLGQANDFTALAIAAPTRADPPIYTIPHVERLPQGVPYTEVVGHVGKLIARLRAPDQETKMSAEVALVVDYTGVGRPIVDMLMDAELDCDLIPVTITAGAHVSQNPLGVSVPKRILATTTQLVLQEQRLKISKRSSFAGILADELKGFRAKISPSGHIAFEAAEDWRSAKHDDLVLALALALWWAEWTRDR